MAKQPIKNEGENKKVESPHKKAIYILDKDKPVNKTKTTYSQG